ncbi:hypothetical protein V7x_25970 [Crateriforma conspicua]|uniref:Uncharacterized protein n=1 Tax=Crateriforma conspicua TaxID=2527996 RepID=A0A5C6FZI5_9PLAN|nr:hypothetical protein [Crateriforma conspicua]TWU67025.1 hypothetical protein V7x_25970 [Crateriforma conspicua]
MNERRKRLYHWLCPPATGRVMAILAAAATVGLTVAAAGYPETFQRWQRAQGCGWGDGYHACQSSGVRPLADMPPRSYSSLYGSPLDRFRGCADGQCGGQWFQRGLCATGQCGCGRCGDRVPAISFYDLFDSSTGCDSCGPALQPSLGTSSCQCGSCGMPTDPSVMHDSGQMMPSPAPAPSTPWNGDEATLLPPVIDQQPDPAEPESSIESPSDLSVDDLPDGPPDSASDSETSDAEADTDADDLLDSAPQPSDVESIQSPSDESVESDLPATEAPAAELPEPAQSTIYQPESDLLLGQDPADDDDLLIVPPSVRDAGERPVLPRRDDDAETLIDAVQSGDLDDLDRLLQQTRKPTWQEWKQRVHRKTLRPVRLPSATQASDSTPVPRPAAQDRPSRLPSGGQHTRSNPAAGNGSTRTVLRSGDQFIRQPW